MAAALPTAVTDASDGNQFQVPERAPIPQFHLGAADVTLGGIARSNLLDARPAQGTLAGILGALGVPTGGGVFAPKGYVTRGVKGFIPDIPTFSEQFNTAPSFTVGVAAKMMVVAQRAGMASFAGANLIEPVGNIDGELPFVVGDEYHPTGSDDETIGAFLHGFSTGAEQVASDLTVLVMCHQVKKLSPENIANYYRSTDSSIHNGTIYQVVDDIARQCVRLVDNDAARNYVRSFKFGDYHTVAVSTPGVIRAMRNDLQAIGFNEPADWALVDRAWDYRHVATAADEVPQAIIVATVQLLAVFSKEIPDWYQGKTAVEQAPPAMTARLLAAARAYKGIISEKEVAEKIRTVEEVAMYVRGETTALQAAIKDRILDTSKTEVAEKIALEFYAAARRNVADEVERGMTTTGVLQAAVGAALNRLDLNA